MDQLSPSCAAAQSRSSSQFLSVDDRKRIAAKAHALLAQRELKPVDVTVIEFLFFRAKERFSGFWFHSHEAIAEACGASVDTVQRSLIRLKGAGLIVWTQRRVSCGRGVLVSLCNAYNFPQTALQLSVEALAAMARQSRADFVLRRVVLAMRFVRSKARVARAAILPVDDPAPSPPRPVCHFSVSLFASKAWKSAASS